MTIDQVLLNVVKYGIALPVALTMSLIIWYAAWCAFNSIREGIQKQRRRDP
jgi:hypothetical protein